MLKFIHRALCLIICLILSCSLLLGQYQLYDIESLKPLRILEIEKSLHEELKARSSITHVQDSSIVYSYWNGEIEFVNSFKYILDTDRKIDTTFSYNLDLITSEFVPSTFTLSHYGDNGSIAFFLGSNWDGDKSNLDDTNPGLIRTYKYFDTGQIKQIETRTGENILQEKASALSVFQYDSLSRLTSLENYFRKNDSLHLTTSRDFRYDSNNLLENSIGYNFDELGREKYIVDSVAYEYFDDEKVKFELQFIPTDGKFIGTTGSSYVYNSNGTINYITPLGYNESDLWFELENRLEHIYDNAENLKKIIKWFFSDESYIDDLDHTVFNHSEIPIENILHNRNFDSHHAQKFMLHESKKFELSASPFKDTTLTRIEKHFYTSLDPTSTTELLQSGKLSFNITPVPANNHINLSLEKESQLHYKTSINILNSEGALVFSRNLDSISTSIDISNFNNGIYFLNVSSQNVNLTKRFAKVGSN